MYEKAALWPHVVDAMAPYVDMFDKSGYVIGIHVRLGFLVPGAGADSQVEPNVSPGLAGCDQHGSPRIAAGAELVHT